MFNSKKIKLTLEELIKNSSKVFIIGHNGPDFDSVGACIGMSIICKHKKKESYIVIDEPIDKLNPGLQKIMPEIQSKLKIINAEEVSHLVDENSTLLVVDANKDYLISLKDLTIFKNIFVLDHHNVDDHTIKTKNIYVDNEVSSASEEVARQMFLSKTPISPRIANFLYAGIVLDLKNQILKSRKETLDILGFLVSRGANPQIVNGFFSEDFVRDRMIHHRLIDNAIFYDDLYVVASEVEESGKVLDKELIAQAADYLLNFSSASFAIGYIDEETISISARSQGDIDVSEIMKELGGGGNKASAATKITGMNIEEVKTRLNEIISEKYDYQKSKLSLKLTPSNS